MTKLPKQTRVLLGGSKGPICPYSFHCRLLELVTPEKILAGDAGDTVGLDPVKLFLWSTVLGSLGTFQSHLKKNP